jgi:hypothetical protein
MALLLAAALILLLTTATLTVPTIATGSPVSFLLGVYLVVWVEAVALSLALSVFHMFDRAGLLIGSALILVAATAVWVSRNRPRPPSFRPALRQLRTCLADPVLGILAATVGLAVVYGTVLGIATAPNEWDALTYHLTRAALWIQQGAVSYVPHASDIRVNGNPPDAEIGQAWTMLFAGNDRFVWLPQMAAVPALVVGVFGVARRSGLATREALFGALVFACLPLVVLQSATALNDLVLASFFVAATYFAIGTTRAGAVGAGLAIGLAFGTKISAPLLLPIYLTVVLVARRRRATEQCASALLGMLLGAVWYGVNLVQTHTLDGAMSAATGQIPGRSPGAVVTRIYELVLDTIELPGASSARDVALFFGFAVVLAIAAVATFRTRRATSLSLATAAAIVCTAPLLLLAEGSLIGWSWDAAWHALGLHEPADELTPFKLSTLADSSSTWYGPIGALLIAGGVVLALRAAGPLRLLRAAMAIAPLVFVIVIAVGLPYDPWRGRFFAYPIALAAAAGGVAYRYRALAWAAVGLTTVTAVLVLATSYTKPPGIRLLAPWTPSVFGKPRWQVQTLLRTYDGTDAVVRYVEKHVPANASVALSLRLDDYAYPYFGAQLGRKVRFVAPGSTASADDSWIVEAPGHSVRRCAASWEAVFSGRSGFNVLRRTGPDACAVSS